ncbi:AmmeMemoRadiSam system protein A [Methylobacter svalbardensis]|uniref:AmmeMemoRadiSam system protein A n=1 Tax=Methylobacter svalbardensis TaxID=3080016 RepID=UPI0030EDA0BC
MSLNKDNRQRLLDLAKNSIRQGLQTGRPIKIDLTDYPRELTEPRATFVTLEINHQLRGCIGMLEAVRPLAEDIAENAYSAAFKDPRFPPLTAEELDNLDIHLSILTPAEPVTFGSEQDLLAQLRPGIDGLILEEPEIYDVANKREQLPPRIDGLTLERGRRRGTFLPSVWEQLPEPEQFLRHLKQKAGLPADYWSKNIRIYRYQAEIIG